MTFRYDVVVAGGGHNSLITAAYLATAGYKVGVVEAMQEVGGNCVTDELLPGFFFDTCASAHSQIQSNPIISRDELGLREFGLEYILPELKVISVFKGGDSIAFVKDIDATIAEIETYSKADGDAYRKLITEVQGLRELFQANATAPGGVPPGSADPVHLKASRFLALSAYDLVMERFRHPLVQASLLAKAAYTIYPPNYPGSARSLIVGIVGNHLGAWATPKGGAWQLTKALRRLLDARG